LVALRRAQATPAERQPTLFPLREDHRPAGERNAAERFRETSLFTVIEPEIEEERRLLYVAMTRAKDQLHLMVPQRFFTHGQRSMGDRHVYGQRTASYPTRC
jgi:superfamily I DNA/RNA helicase